MKIMVSACLLGENCKYNGGNNKNEKLINFLKDKECIIELRQRALKTPNIVSLQKRIANNPPKKPKVEIISSILVSNRFIKLSSFKLGLYISNI